MPVAKSYQSIGTVGEPFVSNKKQYISLKNGKIVRWYSDAEYDRLYPTAVKIEKPKRSLKEVLGFKNGFITLFKGDTYSNLDWFHNSIARYSKVWGWYISSEDEVPQPIPVDLELRQLDWDAVATDEDTLRAESVIKAAVDALMSDPSNSEFIGSVGDRIDIEVSVVKAVTSEGYYGRSTFHLFQDANENLYTWNTAAKSLTVGNTYTIRGTIKSHEIYKGAKQTQLTRCAIIKGE